MRPFLFPAVALYRAGPFAGGDPPTPARESAMDGAVKSPKPDPAAQLAVPPAGASAGGRVLTFCVVTLFVLAGLSAAALCCELTGGLRAAQPENPLRPEPSVPK